jgi:hypothetical protein
MPKLADRMQCGDCAQKYEDCPRFHTMLPDVSILVWYRALGESA